MRTVLAGGLATAIGAAGLTLLPAGAAQAAVPTSFTATGGGFGHGVGLSQYGALGQAKAGRTANQIVTHYYTGTTVGAATDTMEMRVNVAHQVTSLTVTATALAAGGGAWRIGVSGLPMIGAGAGDRAVITRSGTGVAVAVTRANGVALAPVIGATAVVLWNGTRYLNPSGPATLLNAGSDQLRHGRLEIRNVAASSGVRYLEAVNPVRLHNEYLYGIGEMPSSWPGAALQSQAIASRTYALNKYRAHVAAGRPTGAASCGFCHVFDSVSDQVYIGWRKEGQVVGSTNYGAIWRAAVNATAVNSSQGRVVLSAGVPISAFFFSSSAGRTRNSEDVWVTALPYARSVDDHWSTSTDNPNRRWAVSLTQAKVASAFGLANVASLTVTARDVSGAMRTVRAVSSTGQVAALNGETTRSRLGLKSSWVGFTVPVTPATVNPPPLPLAYTTPGVRQSGGTTWRTECVDYSNGIHKCLAYVYGIYHYRLAPGVYVTKPGWRLGITAYQAVNSAFWTGNGYATPGVRTISGKQVKTECQPNIGIGPRLCRSYVWTAVLTRSSTGVYKYVNTWVQSVIVRLTLP